MIIQLILIIFLLFAVSRVILQLKSGNLTAGSFIFWTVLFLVAIIGVLTPELVSKAAKFLGIGRGADVVIYLSIVLRLYLIFRFSITIEDLRHEITKLVREITLSKENKKQK